MNVLSFIVMGTLISTVIWVLQRHKWALWFRIVCGTVIIFGIGVVIFLQSEPPVLGEDRKWYEKSPYLEMVFFALMLAGMAARYFTKAIEVRRDKIAKLEKQRETVVKPKLEFDIWEFSYPLFVSVVTYGALLTQLKDHTFSAGNAMLSFQTGFFWQTVLGARQEKGSPQKIDSARPRRVRVRIISRSTGLHAHTECWNFPADAPSLPSLPPLGWLIEAPENRVASPEFLSGLSPSPDRTREIFMLAHGHQTWPF